MFFRPIKKANGYNEISTVHAPNSSQIQTNNTKETQQLTLSFPLKSSPSKKKSWDFVYSQIGQRILSMLCVSYSSACLLIVG